jgi:hypothetical protein
MKLAFVSSICSGTPGSLKQTIPGNVVICFSESIPVIEPICEAGLADPLLGRRAVGVAAEPFFQCFYNLAQGAGQ